MAFVPSTEWFICEYTTTLIKCLRRRPSRELCGNSRLMGRVSELILFNGKCTNVFQDNF